MTHHKNNIKACEILEEIQEEAGNLWGNCQMYTSEEISPHNLKTLMRIRSDLIRMNRQMER